MKLIWNIFNIILDNIIHFFIKLCSQHTFYNNIYYHWNKNCKYWIKHYLHKIISKRNYLIWLRHFLHISLSIFSKFFLYLVNKTIQEKIILSVIFLEYFFRFIIKLYQKLVYFFILIVINRLIKNKNLLVLIFNIYYINNCIF
jgi:hypothetical protein